MLIQPVYHNLVCITSFFLSSDVAAFFEPSIQCIVKSIKEQCEDSVAEISVRNFVTFGYHIFRTKLVCSKSVFLVGGFAASDWLYQNLKSTFTSRGLDVSRPDSHVYVYHSF